MFLTMMTGVAISCCKNINFIALVLAKCQKRMECHMHVKLQQSMYCSKIAKVSKDNNCAGDLSVNQE